MLQLAFRIWATQMVFFKRPWRIAPSSTEALGMTSITDETSSLWGVIPLPRLLNQQLDSIIEARLAENEQRLLNELQNTIFARRQKEWFVIFLTTFVYLSAVEKDTWSLETWNLEVVKKNEVT